MLASVVQLDVRPAGNQEVGGSTPTTLATFIMKTRLHNFDPLKPHFYIVKLGFTGVSIVFLISAQKQIVGIR